MVRYQEWEIVLLCHPGLGYQYSGRDFLLWQGLELAHIVIHSKIHAKIIKAGGVVKVPLTLNSNKL
jgi:hypothetical protein